MANARTVKAYRELNNMSEKGMSHTVTSRELVRQVPFQNRLFRRFIL